MKQAIYNAKVYVNRGEFAEAVLVEDDLIKKVGTTDEILALAGDAEKLDAAAEKFALKRGNRSARAAKQFIDGIVAGNVADIV